MNEQQWPPADREVDTSGMTDYRTKCPVCSRSICTNLSGEGICYPPFNEHKAADPVNHPTHYNDGKIEVIEFIEDKQLGFHLGNAVKYIARAGKKDESKYCEDLEKAIWYIRRRLELFENHPRRPNDMKERQNG